MAWFRRSAVINSGPERVGVQTGPGPIALRRTPLALYSAAQARVIASSEALLAP
jgi:hypothetical protein